MSQAGKYILTIIILVFFSALFSAVETAYSSASKIRLRNMENDGNMNAGAVLRILDDFDRFLTTVLIGNNIVNIAGATVGTLLFTLYFAGNGPTISTIVITIVTIMFGETAPKSLAKQMPERFACASVGFVRFFEVILSPLSVMMKGWTWLVSKIADIKEDDSDISDELTTMVEEAEREGDLEEHESDLISNAIGFNELDVKDVLSPRVDIVAVDIAESVDKIEEAFRTNGFSRLPVYENSIDNIVGVIHEQMYGEAESVSPNEIIGTI